MSHLSKTRRSRTLINGAKKRRRKRKREVTFLVLYSCKKGMTLLSLSICFSGRAPWWREPYDMRFPCSSSHQLKFGEKKTKEGRSRYVSQRFVDERIKSIKHTRNQHAFPFVLVSDIPVTSRERNRNRNQFSLFYFWLFIKTQIQIFLPTLCFQIFLSIITLYYQIKILSICLDSDHVQIKTLNIYLDSCNVQRFCASSVFGGSRAYYSLLSKSKH